jgi:hypothetical protein
MLFPSPYRSPYPSDIVRFFCPVEKQRRRPIPAMPDRFRIQTALPAIRSYLILR